MEKQATTKGSPRKNPPKSHAVVKRGRTKRATQWGSLPMWHAKLSLPTILRSNTSRANQAEDISGFHPCGIQHFELWHGNLTRCFVDLLDICEFQVTYGQLNTWYKKSVFEVGHYFKENGTYQTFFRVHYSVSTQNFSSNIEYLGVEWRDYFPDPELY